MAIVVIIRNKFMARTQGAKTLSPNEKDEIKSIIRSRLKYRDTNDELLEKLEDEDHNISLSKLKELKTEIRSELGKRFEEIGTYELMEEYDGAVDNIKMLLKTYNKEFNEIEDPVDRTRIGQEIRNSLQDLMSLYSKAEVVEQVLKYFQEEYGEKKEEGIKEIKAKVKHEKPLR